MFVLAILQILSCLSFCGWEEEIVLFMHPRRHPMIGQVMLRAGLVWPALAAETGVRWKSRSMMTIVVRVVKLVYDRGLEGITGIVFGVCFCEVGLGCRGFIVFVGLKGRTRWRFICFLLNLVFWWRRWGAVL